MTHEAAALNFHLSVFLDQLHENEAQPALKHEDVKKKGAFKHLKSFPLAVLGAIIGSNKIIESDFLKICLSLSLHIIYLAEKKNLNETSNTYVRGLEISQ